MNFGLPVGLGADTCDQWATAAVPKMVYAARSRAAEPSGDGAGLTVCLHDYT